MARAAIRLAVMLTAWLGAIVGMFPTPAAATVLAEVPIDDMIWDADAIVLGEVVRVTTRVEVQNDRPEPWTAATVRVDRWLSGGGRSQVLIEERGGEWVGGGMRIAGTPEYAVGERVLVFLWRDHDGRMRTYGMVQGKFVLRSGVRGVPTTVERDLEDVGFAEWHGERMTIVHHEPAVMQLDAILLRIEQVLTARAAPAVPAPQRTVR